MSRVAQKSRSVLCLVWLLVSCGAQGALSLAGTRLIFDGKYSEVSIEAHNTGRNDVLVQATLSDPYDDDDTPLAERRRLPFVVTPPLSRMPAGSKQMLRVLYQGAGMPSDEESLLHLYVLEVPHRQTNDHQLSIAVRQRINVFYRPDGLEGDPAVSAERLRWAIVSSVSDAANLSIDNPTAYHVTLENVQWAGVKISDYVLLAPNARVELPLIKGSATAAPRRLTFNALTDYGARRSYCARSNEQGPFTAHLQDMTFFQDEC